LSLAIALGDPDSAVQQRHRHSKQQPNVKAFRHERSFL
jgi:hypothetical protein